MYVLSKLFYQKKSFLQTTVFLKYLISIYFSIHLSVSIQLHTSKLCIRQPGPHKESHCYPSKIYFDLSLVLLKVMFVKYLIMLIFQFRKVK